MQAAVIYWSKTGNTAKAARAIGDGLEAAGADVQPDAQVGTVARHAQPSAAPSSSSTTRWSIRSRPGPRARSSFSGSSRSLSAAACSGR